MDWEHVEIEILDIIVHVFPKLLNIFDLQTWSTPKYTLKSYDNQMLVESE